MQESPDREQDMERVDHFLNLKRGAISVRKSDKTRYVHMVSGECAIAIKESCFIESMFDRQNAFETPGSIHLVTNSEDFEVVSHCDNLYLDDFCVMDFHDIFFQKWNLKGAHWPLSTVFDIRAGIRVERPSDGKQYAVAATYLCKAILYAM